MTTRIPEPVPVAGNGLMDRRFFLRAGAAGGATLMTAAANADTREAWMRLPGAGMSESGSPSAHESHLRRVNVGSRQGTTGSGSSRTPLEYLDGIITPSRLHFERHHSGIPDIDPAAHRLVIHGLVERPLRLTLKALKSQFKQHDGALRFRNDHGGGRAQLIPAHQHMARFPVHNQQISVLGSGQDFGLPLATDCLERPAYLALLRQLSQFTTDPFSDQPSQ